MTPSDKLTSVNKVIQECCGFKASSGRSLSRMLLLPVEAALIPTLAGVAPNFAARLLASCSLREAERVLLKLIDGRCYLISVSVHSKKAHLSVFSRTLDPTQDADDKQPLRTIKLFRRLYCYSLGQDEFQPVPAMPPHLPHQICTALETLRLINTAGEEWKGLNAVQKQLRRDTKLLYGTPRALLKLRPGFTLKGRAYESLFALQMLEVAYMMYAGRWFYPVLSLILLLISFISLAGTTRRQRLKIMALVNECRLTPLVWEGWVRAVSSHRLLPGDIVVLRPGKAMCDMIMLQGSCLVMESMLSGEAAQVRKSNYVPEKGVDYDPEKHHTCTVYAGTMVQQVWNPQDSQDEVLVMVVRNGLNTTVGNMVREIVSPKQHLEDDHFKEDVFRLYAFAFCLQCLIHIPYFIKAHALHSPEFHVRTILDMLLYSAPPGLPLMMLLIGVVSSLRLQREKMSLLYWEVLGKGACADVVAFDKTGTLTHSAAELHGVLPVQKGEFQGIQQMALRWPNRLKQAVAVCNGLTMVGKHTVVGVDMERTMFKAVEARFLDRKTVVLPRQADSTSPALMAKLSIVKVMEFTSQTLRSGVVVFSNDAPKGSALLFLRGAPAVIRDLVQPASVPANFNEVMNDFSSNSFRLLAMAVGVIPKAAQLSLVHMTQQQVEASALNMHLLCLLVLTNNIRSDSKATVTHLQEGGGLRTLMITGDYHHTAVAVAKDVGMVKPNSQVVVIDTVRHDHGHDHPTALSGTPDSGLSSEVHHHPTPHVSFRALPTVHECFIPPQDGSPRAGFRFEERVGVRSAAPSELRQADSLSAQAVKEGKHLSTTAQLLPGSCQISLSAEPIGSVEQQLPSAIGIPHAGIMSMVVTEPAGDTKLPCKVTSLPGEGANLNRTPRASPIARRSQIKLQPLAQHCEAASAAPLLITGKVTFEQPPSTAQLCPLRVSFEGPPPSRQLSRVSSLTRLPSEAASLLTTAALEPCSALDDLSLNRQGSVLRSSSKLMRASVTELRSFKTHSGESSRAGLLSLPECGSRGLTFTSGAGRQHVDPCDALKAMAEGSMQCAVTGDAFELLLQLREASLLETVLRNAVVFSRMQPHQKGQVMDLLGSRGVHQPKSNGGNPRHIQGLGNTTIFCGDGINDLPALAAADVGVSIGASEAFIASSISMCQPSIAGVCTFIRIGKGAHAMMVSLFKYMVLYQCILGQMQCSALYMDDSNLSTLQITVVDAEAMIIALAACLVPPLAQLNRHKPADRLCKAPTLVLLFVMAVCLQCIEVLCFVLLATRPWFHGGNGTARDNSVVTVFFMTGNMQLLAPLISLLLETRPYCQSPFKSQPMLSVALFYTVLAYSTILTPWVRLWNPIHLFDFPQSFRWELGGQIVVLTVVYTVVIRVTRRVLACYEHRRLRPA